jgi:hypothetical protein
MTKYAISVAGEILFTMEAEDADTVAEAYSKTEGAVLEGDIIILD